MPAWCDRVLYAGSARVTHYASCRTVRVSDHRPVGAVVTTFAKRVDDARRARTYVECIRWLDRMENEQLPSATLAPTDVHFEHMRFLERGTRAVLMRNTGQVGSLLFI